MLGRLGWIRGRLLSRCLSRNRKCLCAAFLPKTLGDLQRFDIQVVPPGHFVTGLMQLLMVITAKRHGELIADFKTQRSGLSKAQMVRIGRLTPADQAWL